MPSFGCLFSIPAPSRCHTRPGDARGPSLGVRLGHRTGPGWHGAGRVALSFVAAQPLLDGYEAHVELVSTLVESFGPLVEPVRTSRESLPEADKVAAESFELGRHVAHVPDRELLDARLQELDLTACARSRHVYIEVGSVTNGDDGRLDLVGRAVP